MLQLLFFIINKHNLFFRSARNTSFYNLPIYYLYFLVYTKYYLGIILCYIINNI